MRVKGRLVAAVFALVAGACSDAPTDDAQRSPEPSVGEAALEQGGTLHLAQLGDVDAGFDPNKSYYSVNWEYYRCCLVRTLMS